MIVAIEPLLVSVDEAKKMIGCGTTFFYELINTGRVQAKKQGRSTVIPVESLRSYVASLQDVTPTPPSSVA